jgi:hypothetical protein
MRDVRQGASAPAWPGSKGYDGTMKDLRYFDPHRHATWLELFFDLIVVVALRDAGEILSETHDGHIAPQQFLHFVVVFLPLWSRPASRISTITRWPWPATAGRG